MDESYYTHQDTCDLVNEEPVAFKGLTLKEMGLSLGVFFCLVFPPSVVLAIVFDAAWIALIGFAVPILCVYFLAGAIEEFRRGKPPGYLSHFIAVKMRKFKRPSFIYITYKWGLGRQNGSKKRI
ncbi:TIGR03750 family conjugal transfer protein [Vibrio europaeus]|uniref:DUF3487 family protein n=1 Tax=Vibrio europaeus TaxID=300876 RepID=UPI00233F1AAF|nr:DUF3487 family protein [Vibrio europaeus]MDC5870283.1 TIGR03750 family conjugal transfer protein [Vibrio europaeus]